MAGPCLEEGVPPLFPPHCSTPGASPHVPLPTASTKHKMREGKGDLREQIHQSYLIEQPIWCLLNKEKIRTVATVKPQYWQALDGPENTNKVTELQQTAATEVTGNLAVKVQHVPGSPCACGLSPPLNDISATINSESHKVFYCFAGSSLLHAAMVSLALLWDNLAEGKSFSNLELPPESDTCLYFPTLNFINRLKS